MSPHELEDLTYRHMPDRFLKAVLQAVFQAHSVAWADCAREFPETEALNVLGYYRRGKLESLLRDVAARFPEMEARVERSEGSNWNHTEIHSGPIILTENSVSTPCALVEKAEFRLTLARSNQLTLWDEAESNDSPLYLLLLHSRSRWDSREDRHRWGFLPGSAYIAYPTPSLDYYVHEINLFERYPDVVASRIPQEWNNEAQTRYLGRASKARVA